METKGARLIAGSIVLASVILGLAHILKPSAVENHYQMDGVPGHAYVIDTQTGQVWEQFASDSSGSSDSGFKTPKPK